MIYILKKTYGYKILKSGIISVQDVEKFQAESELNLAQNNEKFSVFVDMRKVEILPAECKDLMYKGQRLYKQMGMERSVVIVADSVTAMQLQLLAKKTEIHEFERYIDASTNQNWEEEGLGWLLHTKEPCSEKELA